MCLRAIAAVAAAAVAALVAAPLAAAHGDSVPADKVWTTWRFEPIVLLAAAIAIAFFLQGWLRLRGRGRTDHAGWDRLALFSGGIAVIVFAVVSPIDPVSDEYLQSAHMLQHVLLADVGVALLILAVRGPLIVFFLPRLVLKRIARSRPLRAAAGFVTRPSITVGLWVVVLVGWHVPSLYEAALRHGWLHDLEHLSFVIVGTLVWVQLIDPLRQRRLSIGERIGLAAVVFWVGQILAYVVLFDPSPLFETYIQQDERLLGLSPLTDQKLAGVIMMVEQLITVGTCLLVLVGEARRKRADDVPPVFDDLRI